jgi:hypothetical protein
MIDPTWIDIVQKISGVSFATFLLLLGVAGYYQKWVWGWQMNAALEREQIANKRAEYWQNLYLTRVVPLEKTVEKISGVTA